MKKLNLFCEYNYGQISLQFELKKILAQFVVKIKYS